MKYAEGKVLQDGGRTLSSFACYGKWLFLIASMPMIWSIALCRLQYPVVQQEEERAGREGFPRLPSSWGCWSVNLYTLGLKGPSVNDLLTLILVWSPFLKVLFAVWAVSLSAVLLGVSIFTVMAGSKVSGVLRQTW